MLICENPLQKKKKSQQPKPGLGPDLGYVLPPSGELDPRRGSWLRPCAPPLPHLEVPA